MSPTAATSRASSPIWNGSDGSAGISPTCRAISRKVVNPSRRSCCTTLVQRVSRPFGILSFRRLAGSVLPGSEWQANFSYWIGNDEWLKSAIRRYWAAPILKRMIMKIIFALLGLTASFISFCVGAQDVKMTPSNTTSIENKYIHTRDQYIAHFAKVPASQLQDGKVIADIGKALADLEKQLKVIIGPIQVKGFPTQGRTNVDSLVQELGFNMVDGLKYTNQSNALFVTTNGLLSNYLQRNPEYPKDLNHLAETGKFGASMNFFSEVFDEDVSVTTYLEFPIKKAKGQSFARAFLGIFSQDIGPAYLPTQIFAIVARGDKIFVVSVVAKTEIAQIEQCQKQSDALWKKSEDALIAYRNSDLKDSSLFEKKEKYEERSFLEYRRCFGRESKKQSFFAPLTSEVQSIVDSL